MFAVLVVVVLKFNLHVRHLLAQSQSKKAVEQDLKYAES